MDRGAWQATVHAVARVGHQLATKPPPPVIELGSVVKNMPAMQEMQETRVQSLGQEDPLEKKMATHSSILAWRIPVERGPWWATVRGVAKSLVQLSSQGVSD